MRRLVFLSVISILALPSAIFAQVTFVSPEYQACDSLIFTSFLSPSNVYDTLGSIEWIIDEDTLYNAGDTLTRLFSSPGIYDVAARVNNKYLIPAPEQVMIASRPGSDFFFRDSLSGYSYSYVFRYQPDLSDTSDLIFTWQVNNIGVGSDDFLFYSFDNAGLATVSLNVTNSFGCSDSTSKTLFIREYLKCPNVFTPNRDGHNDFFSVATHGLTVYRFTVFSRIGLKVYESESPQILWDGRSLSGLEMQPGVYYYTIEPLNGDNREVVTGFIQLIRE